MVKKPHLTATDASRMAKSVCLPWDEVSDFAGNYSMHMTLEEIAKAFGVTRERIRQIEAKAIKKLQHKKRAEILKEFL